MIVVLSRSSDQRQDVLVPVVIPALSSVGSEVAPEQTQSAVWTGKLYQESLKTHKDNNQHQSLKNECEDKREGKETYKNQHIQTSVSHLKLLAEFLRIFEDQSILLMFHQLM